MWVVSEGERRIAAVGLTATAALSHRAVNRELSDVVMSRPVAVAQFTAAALTASLYRPVETVANAGLYWMVMNQAPG